MKDVRPAAVAGSWYPGTRVRLERAVDAHLSAVSPVRSRGCPRALVVPHAGLVYSGPVAAHAYAAIGACRYAAAVLVGPSHFVGFHGVSIWPRGAWSTPLGEIRVAEDLSAAIQSTSADILERPDAHAREHSLEMQLPFVARLLAGVPIVPLVMGYQTRETAEALGDALAGAIRAWGAGAVARDVLLIASTDLSHFEDAATATALDEVVIGCVERFDPDGLMEALEREPRHACGGGPTVSVLRAARALGARDVDVLRYADSGDVSGDKASVVGYMAAAVW